VSLDFEGAAYSRASTLQRQWGQHLLNESDLGGDEVILDLGCGDGALTAQWADRVPNGRVVGVDRSQGMLRYARHAHSRPNINYWLDDIENLPPESSVYDLIISNAVLHWVQGHELLLAKLYDMLRPGGKVRLSFGAEGNCHTFFAITRAAMQLPSFVASFRNFNWPWRNETVDQYRQLLVKTPFTEIQVWGQVADATFPCSEAIVAWMEQPLLVPFLAHLPHDLRQSFRDTVVNNMLAVSLQGDGTYFEYFRKINVRALRGCRKSVP